METLSIGKSFVKAGLNGFSGSVFDVFAESRAFRCLSFLRKKESSDFKELWVPVVIPQKDRAEVPVQDVGAEGAYKGAL